MTRRAREAAPALALGMAAVWAMTYVGLYGFGWNDYSTEVAPAYDALTAGHFGRFLALAPAYGGSLELRAPFALLATLGGGGEVAVYRAVSIPCLVAAALLATWLLVRLRRLGRGRLDRALVLGLCVANPVTLYALQYGHAEELLGAVLCVGAVLAAQRGYAGWSGLLLGLAIVNKQWALVAVGPVLVALPAQRWRALALAATVATCFYLPLLAWPYLGHAAAGGPSGPSGPSVLASGGSSIFQPWQLWWFLGAHGHLVVGSAGVVKVGYRMPPGWIESLSHPMIVMLSAALSLIAWRRGARDGMLLLAFVLALRCALDTWDVVYYPLPFILALVCWEAFRWRRPPVLSLAASVVVWLVFIAAPRHLPADAQAALFLVAALPVLAALAAALYAPALLARLVARGRSSAVGSAPIPTV